MKQNIRHGYVRFVAIIEGVEYTFRLIRHDDDSKVYRLSKRDGEQYQVAVTNQGYACNCKDNIYRNPPGGCKHIRAFRANGLI